MYIKRKIQQFISSRIRLRKLSFKSNYNKLIFQLKSNNSISSTLLTRLAYLARMSQLLDKQKLELNCSNTSIQQEETVKLLRTTKKSFVFVVLSQIKILLLIDRLLDLDIIILMLADSITISRITTIIISAISLTLTKRRILLEIIRSYSS